jgi:hypothetical protein
MFSFLWIINDFFDSTIDSLELESVSMPCDIYYVGVGHEIEIEIEIGINTNTRYHGV